MYTRKVDYIELIADQCLLDEPTIDRLTDAVTYMPAHEINYSVTWLRGEADKICPSPYAIAKEVSCLLFDKIRSFNIAIEPAEFNQLFRAVKLDAEKWEEDNWDMLIDQDEIERKACHDEARMDAAKEKGMS